MPDWDLLSSYAGLLSLATFSVYTGAFGSLPPEKRRHKDGTVLKNDDEDEDEVPERLSSEDAWLFPIIGSGVLLGLYLVVRYFGTELINWLLRWYFTAAGLVSGGKAIVSLVRWAVGPARWRQYDLVKLTATKGPKSLFSVSLRAPALYLVPLGALPSVLYALAGDGARRSALLTDVLALSFAFNALSLLTIDSFKTGCILLAGLFLYDVWWVFGTEVMVKVATTLDVPIKLLWAKSLTFASARGFTMLGLGDIVIPGMFVALALRYDRHRALQLQLQNQTQNSPQASQDGFAKPYFHAALGAYAGGLATTMGVMHVFRAAQPALLYLSPACILSFVLTAHARGELGAAWAWSDETPESGKLDDGGKTKQDGDAAQEQDGDGATQDANGNDARHVLDTAPDAASTTAVAPAHTESLAARARGAS